MIIRKPHFVLLFSTAIALGGFAALFGVTTKKDVVLSYQIIDPNIAKPQATSLKDQGVLELHSIKIGVGYFNYGKVVNKCTYVQNNKVVEKKLDSKYQSFDAFVNDSQLFVRQIINWKSNVQNSIRPNQRIKWSDAAENNINLFERTISMSKNWFLTSTILFGVWGGIFLIILVMLIIWIVKNSKKEKKVETNFDLFWQIS